MSSENVLNNLNIENRIKELIANNKLFWVLGNNSFILVKKYNVSVGYQTGFGQIIELTETGNLNNKIFYNDPMKVISKFLDDYFKNRGGNLA